MAIIGLVDQQRDRAKRVEKHPVEVRRAGQPGLSASAALTALTCMHLDSCAPRLHRTHRQQLLVHEAFHGPPWLGADLALAVLAGQSRLRLAELATPEAPRLNQTLRAVGWEPWALDPQAYSSVLQWTDTPVGTAFACAGAEASKPPLGTLCVGARRQAPPPRPPCRLPSRPPLATPLAPPFP